MSIVLLRFRSIRKIAKSDSFLMSVCPHGAAGLPLMDLSVLNFVFENLH